jgi:hypothetical protein
MRVIQNITGLSDTGETIDVDYYTGDSLAQAMNAMVMAAAASESRDKWYKVNSVRLELDA